MLNSESKLHKSGTINTKNQPKQILIVEDHPIFSFGLRALIEQEGDLVVSGIAEDISMAWKLINSRVPDIAIVDIALKGRNGIELIKDIKKHFKSLPVLVLSMHDESLYAERALASGASGYVMKQEASMSIVSVIRRVLAGEVCASKSVLRKIVNNYAGQPNSCHIIKTDRLTDRELEVLQGIAEGLATRQIAKRLNLSIKTIGTYRERIKRKLELNSAAELTYYAINWSKAK